MAVRDEHEITYRWEDLDEVKIQQVVAAHAAAIQTGKQISGALKRDLLRRCFELARPNIVMGRTHCRIHPDSVEVVKTIMRQYYH